MTAKKVCILPEPSLQELLDPPRQIPQRDIIELLKLRDQIALLRADRDAVAAQLTDRVMQKWPVQRGPFAVRLGERGLEILQGEVKL